MNEREFDVFGEGFAAFGELLRNHVENVVKFSLRLVRGLADSMAALEGGNVCDIAAIVIATGNDLVIEQSLHYSSI
jgi:hypothetical protein